MTTLETPLGAVLLNRQIDAIDAIVPKLPQDTKQQLAEALVVVVKTVSFSYHFKSLERVQDLSMSLFVPSGEVMDNRAIALKVRSILRANCFVQLLCEIGVAVNRGMSDAIRNEMCGDEPSHMAGIDVHIKRVDGEAYASFGVVHTL